MSESEVGDRALADLLAASHDLADAFYSALPEIGPGRFPESTVYRAIAATVPLYEAALTALGDAHSSLGAVALIRPLIENWTHFDFIASAGDPGADCRALQLELGWAEATEQLVQGADPARLPLIQARVAEVKQMLQDLGCIDLAPRSYRSAWRSVEKIADELDLDWLPGAWQSSSQAVHGSGWEWLLQDGAGWTQPSMETRAGWLNNLLWLFNTFTQGAFMLLGQDLESGAPLEIRQRIEDLLDTPLLVASRA